jgi:hypothetical protein
MILIDDLFENVDIKRELSSFVVSISGKIGCVLESVFQGKNFGRGQGPPLSLNR